MVLSEKRSKWFKLGMLLQSETSARLSGIDGSDERLN